MDFATAVQVCFKKYTDFTGRAQRSEYWYFFLFSFLLQLLVDIVTGSEFASGIVSLGLLLPSLAVGARRLHDTNRSGWWLLLGLIPVLGWIVLLVFLVKEGDKGDNDFGYDPLDRTVDPHEPAQHDVDAEPAPRSRYDDDNGNDGDDDNDDDEISNEDNPWVKARREKAEAAKEEAAAKKQEKAAQKKITEEKKRRIEPPKFGRDAAKKDKKDK
ncbi:DUF805 domain-containing protein [Lentilitoribacter sp. EG35]|jgi:uncharacterized membrane protein YhaH (DUF805 family)|uniref:DUF805 domain-containing protein n=1 Tax=Lentilitoribacter sp. EG35 TaxID=3234192 RepID=UPI00345F6A13